MRICGRAPRLWTAPQSASSGPPSVRTSRPSGGGQPEVHMSTITVELDATAALAGALDGEVGVRAAECAAGWAEVVGVLAERCAVTGRALAAAVGAYREAEAARAAEVAVASRPGQGPR